MTRFALAASVAAVLAGATACSGGGAGGGGGPATCPAGQQSCAGACFDLRTSTAHCGACGVACAATQVCAAGSCGCPSGTTACGAACADLATSAAHCGTCGNPCPAGAACSGGVCGAICTPPETACGLVCTNLQAAASDCGRCGRACAEGATCSAGACTATACTGLLDLPGAPLHAADATALAAADLDGDGDLDLVGSWNDRITVQHATGGGRFAVAQTIFPPALPVGAWIDALILARLDGDEDLDLAAADRRGYVHVARGVAGGTFGAVVSVSLAYGGADGVAAADLDGDGDLDLGVSADGGQLGNGSAIVLWNDGTGAFPTQIALGATGRLSDVAAGDVNGDGRPDVLVSEYPAGRVRVHLASSSVANGFEPEQAVTMGGLTQTLALADLDGDTQLDLVTSSWTGGDAQATWVARGNGDGTFAEAVEYAAGADDLAVADVDGDGNLDVALATGGLLLGAGDATFAVSTIDISTGGTIGIAAADLDGDLSLDLAYGNRQVALRAAGGGWLVPTSPLDATLLAVADVNGDLDPDLVARDGAAQRLVVALGRGDGAFSEPTVASPAWLPSTPRLVAPADLDGDGRLDLVACDGATDTVVTWLGDGTGMLDPGPSFAASTVVELAAADLDGDGRADLVTLEDDPAVTEYGPVRLRFGAGGGAFGPPVTLEPDGTAIAIADMNGDGAADVLVGKWTGRVLRVLLGAGDGTFASAPDRTIGDDVTGIAPGDLDGDGTLDLVVSSWVSYDGPGSFVATLAGLGEGALDVPVHLSALTGTRPERTLLADLDADGRDELLVWADGLGALALLGNAGDGTFEAPLLEPAWFAQVASVSDVNRDGRPDVVAYAPNGDGVRVLRTGCRPLP